MPDEGRKREFCIQFGLDPIPYSAENPWWQGLGRRILRIPRQALIEQEPHRQCVCQRLRVERTRPARCLEIIDHQTNESFNGCIMNTGLKDSTFDRLTIHLQSDLASEILL